MTSLHRAARNPYGRPHRRRRNALLHAAVGTPCPGAVVDGVVYRSRNCTRLMLDPALMHLDHTTPLVLGGTVGDRIICKPCNLSAGAVIGNRLRRPLATPLRPRRTRMW